MELESFFRYYSFMIQFLNSGLQIHDPGVINFLGFINERERNYQLKYYNFIQVPRRVLIRMSTICHTDTNLFQIQLSQDQARVIAKRMPPGFSVLQCRYTKREAAKKVQQDLSSEEEHKVIKKTQVEPLKTGNDEMKRCTAILQRLKRFPAAAPFLKKLDNVNYPLEWEYVDLQIVEQNLKNNIYATSTQFWGDVNKIWQMSYTMNNKGTQIYAMTQEIEQQFNELYREMEKPMINHKPKEQKQESIKKQAAPQIKQQKPRQNTVKPKISKPPVVNKMETPMNMNEKKALVQNIHKLPQEHLRGVWEIVSDGLKIHDQNEEFEFDIDTLPTKKTRLLEKYVNSKLEFLKKQQNKKSEEAQITETADKMHKPPQQYFAPLPNKPEHDNDTGDSSFSSDADDSD